jgi:staphylococcal nuclease domain-containing protein 1
MSLRIELGVALCVICWHEDSQCGDHNILQTTEKRQFGTVSVGKRPDVAETLVSEGLAVTQRHRDDDETSPRYDELRAAEAVAKAAKKGVHSEKDYKKGAVNDLTEPRKAKAYSGSLMRAGTLKAVVEYVFNGARFKLLVPSENCYIVFAPNYLRCPQPSPGPGSRQTRAAEPFGDASKRHARLTLLQRTVEITCTGVTNGGVITGDLFVGQGGQRRDYGLELVGAGLATVDQRKIDYGEAPKNLIDAQLAAQNNKVGVWFMEQPTEEVCVVGESAVSFAVQILTGCTAFSF